MSRKTLAELKCEYDKQFFFMRGIEHFAFSKKKSDQFLLVMKNGANHGALLGKSHKLRAKVENFMPRGNAMQRMIVLNSLQWTEPF